MKDLPLFNLGVIFLGKGELVARWQIRKAQGIGELAQP